MNLAPRVHCVKHYNFQTIVSMEKVQQPTRSSVTLAYRRMINDNEVERYTVALYKPPTKGESLREYVPGPGIGDPYKWYRNRFFYLLALFFMHERCYFLQIQ